MYSYEIDELIKKYNYNIPSSVYIKISNVRSNPQIDHVEYNAWSNNFIMWTNDGYSWTFSVYKE